MNFKLKKATALAACFCFVLSGCVTNQAGTGASGGVSVGPQTSSAYKAAAAKARAPMIDPRKPKLEVIVPVFDPGLTADAEQYKEEGIWPELRRAEANRFAVRMAQAMVDTQAFGAVRVTPDSTATGDLYVLGKILESDGQDVEIQIQVADITGDTWFTRNFEHEVDAGFYKNPRNQGRDAYDPVFQEAAWRIVEELQNYSVAELQTMQRITELRFGSNFTEQAFAEHLDANGRTYELVSFPSNEDPMLQRTRAVRVRDQLFVDGLQDHYKAFSNDMEDSYLVWQEQSFQEQAARDAANRRTAEKAALGVLAIGLGVLAAVAGGRSGSIGGRTAGTTGAIAGGMIGAKLLTESFQTSEEAKVHRDALEELGQSIDIDLAPRVMEFDKQTVQLTGDARAQFAQWRAFLQQIFEQERTPAVQL